MHLNAETKGGAGETVKPQAEASGGVVSEPESEN